MQRQEGPSWEHIFERFNSRQSCQTFHRRRNFYSKLKGIYNKVGNLSMGQNHFDRLGIFMLSAMDIDQQILLV